MAWTEVLGSKPLFMTFFKWAQQEEPAIKKVVTRFMLLETLQGRSTPVPAPLQCKSKPDRTAECVVSLYRSESKKLLGSTCKSAYGAVDSEIKPNTRAAEDFVKARELMEENGVSMDTLYGELLNTQNSLSDEIEDLYSRYPKDEMEKEAKQGELDAVREKFEFALNAIKTAIDETATDLEGTIKKKTFHYYGDVAIGNIKQAVLIVRDKSSQYLEEYNTGKYVKGTIVEKGTNKLTRNKYFKYKGALTKKEMFEALKATGWNMKNLKKADDLELVS